MDHLTVDSFSSYEAYALSVVGRYALHGGGCSCGSAACAAVQLVIGGSTGVFSVPGLEQQGCLDSWTKRPVSCGVEWSPQFRSSRVLSLDRYGGASGTHDVLGIESVVAVDSCDGAAEALRGENRVGTDEEEGLLSSGSDRGRVDTFQSGDDLGEAEGLRNCLGSNSKVPDGVRCRFVGCMKCVEDDSELDSRGLSGVSKSCGGVTGPNGGVSYGRKGNYRRNQASRDRKKEKNRRASYGVVEEKTMLQKSSESKWQAQNRLAALRAEREIAILEATDLEEEKRKRRAQVCAATERNLVSIEKFHNDLRKSGNTSSDDDTRVNTVISAGAGSISPSSSISEADVRRAKKELEDAIAEKKKAIEREKKLAAALTRMGQNPEAIIGYGSAEVGDLDAKTEWTVDSKGRITDDNEAILEVIYPDGYMVIHDDIDFVHPDGKNKVRLVGGPRYSVTAPMVEEEDDDARTHWSLGSHNEIPEATALKLHEKFPDGYRQNFSPYTDAVTGKLRGVIRPTALDPRVLA